jgi:hypothetical protein
MGGAAGGYRCEQRGAVTGEGDDQSGGFVLGRARRLAQGRSGSGRVGGGGRRSSRRRDGAGGGWARSGAAELGAQRRGMRHPVRSERSRRCGQRRVGVSLRLAHRLRQRCVSLRAPGW